MAAAKGRMGGRPGGLAPRLVASGGIVKPEEKEWVPIRGFSCSRGDEPMARCQVGAFGVFKSMVFVWSETSATRARPYHALLRGGGRHESRGLAGPSNRCQRNRLSGGGLVRPSWGDRCRALGAGDREQTIQPGQSPPDDRPPGAGTRHLPHGRLHGGSGELRSALGSAAPPDPSSRGAPVVGARLAR